MCMCVVCLHACMCVCAHMLRVHVCMFPMSFNMIVNASHQMPAINTDHRDFTSSCHCLENR